MSRKGINWVIGKNSLNLVYLFFVLFYLGMAIYTKQFLVYGCCMIGDLLAVKIASFLSDWISLVVTIQYKNLEMSENVLVDDLIMISQDENLNVSEKEKYVRYKCDEIRREYYHDHKLRGILLDGLGILFGLFICAVTIACALSVIYVEIRITFWCSVALVLLSATLILVLDKVEDSFEDESLIIVQRQYVLNRKLKKEAKEYEKEQKRILHQMESLDKMDGEEFEDALIELLEENDFEEVEKTATTGDYGLDILCIKNNVRYGIQCKRYDANVGVKAVQEAFAATQYYDCDVAVVCTNSHFTKSAKMMAEKNNVELWDREKLEEML